MSEEDREPDSAGTSQERKPGGINWKLVDRLAKLFVVGLILLLCWNVLQSMFFMAPSRTDSEVRSAQATRQEVNTLDANQQLLMDFTRGSWRFGDGDWQLRVFPETEQQGLFSVPDFRRSEDAKFDDQEFVDMFKGLGAKPLRTDEGFEIWQVNRPGFSFVMISYDSVIQVVRTRYNTGSGFSIVEGKPRSSDAVEKDLLLPIEEGVSQIATRTDRRGQTTSAILKIESDYTGDLRSVWRQHQWNVRPLQTTVGEVQSERYSCSNAAGEIIEAIFFLDETTRRPTQILLNRMPTLSE